MTLVLLEDYSEALEDALNDKKRLKELTKGKIKYKGWWIKVRRNDITDEPVDAIVNPANSNLENKGGAAKMIEDAAGKVLVDEWYRYTQEIGKLEIGKTLVTKAGDLPCSKVIHVVGPKWTKGQKDLTVEKQQLKEVMQNILKTMVEKDFKVVCILAVSTGIFNFPLDECAKIYAKVIRKFIDENEEKMKGRELVLCNLFVHCLGNFDKPTTDAMMEGRLSLILQFSTELVNIKWMKRKNIQRKKDQKQ